MQKQAKRRSRIEPEPMPAPEPTPEPPQPQPVRKRNPIAKQPSPRCCYCDATTLTVLKKLTEAKHCGVTIEGERYTSIVRRRVRCNSCGRCQIHVVRPYVPAAWNN